MKYIIDLLIFYLSSFQSSFYIKRSISMNSLYALKVDFRKNLNSKLNSCLHSAAQSHAPLRHKFFWLKCPFPISRYDGYHCHWLLSPNIMTLTKSYAHQCVQKPKRASRTACPPPTLHLTFFGTKQYRCPRDTFIN